MPRARNIKPGFFKNEDLAECSSWARLCFAGLWTLADREGRLEDRPKRIKGELFPFDAFDVEPLLGELCRRGFIVRYEIDGQRCIQISKFLAHQSPHYSEKPSAIKPPEFRWSHPPSMAEDSKNTPGAEPSLRGGRNPLNPDSPNPDSLKKTSGAEAPAAAAALPPGPEPKPMSDRDRVWALGVPLLGEEARALLGKLAKAHGEDVLAGVLAEATLDKPLEPKAWVIAACEAKGKPKLNGKHHEPQTTLDLLRRDPHAEWATQAGFETIFDAESAGCGPGNASKFRDGKRVVR